MKRGEYRSLPATRKDALALAALLTVAAAALFSMGQPLWCAVGDWALLNAQVNSPHNSQHLADPYSLTHMLHGVGFYALLWTFAAGRLEQRARFFVAMGVEAAWEIFENTDFIIGRYREATISLDYFGDSIINSIGDIISCALGYGLAATLPVYGSVALFAGIELLLLVWIRDSLLLNIIMLLAPVEAIKNWQMGG